MFTRVALATTLAVTAGAAKTLKLTWSDCGDASTHAKVTSLSTDHIVTGTPSPVTGTGTVDEDVAGGSYAIDLAAGPIKEHWTGDICEPKTFNLPLAAGSIKWLGMKCPQAKGTATVGTEIDLSSLLPSFLTHANIKITATDKAGNKLLCFSVATAPETELVDEAAAQLVTASSVDEYTRVVSLATTPAVTSGAAKTLKLTWSDCGDASTHAKVTSISTDHIVTGTPSPVIGTGTVDEDVAGGSYAIDLAAGPIKEHWTGDICEPKTFNLPLGTGSIKWLGIKCPQAKGTATVGTEIDLSSSLPSFLTTANIKITATDKASNKLICFSVATAPETELVEAAAQLVTASSGDKNGEYDTRVVV